MDESSPEDLRKELANLEAAETKLSIERRRLHHQIDYGFASAETRAREREVSAERRELHKRLDALRERLGEDVPVAGRESATSESPLNSLGQWSGISPQASADDASADELEL